MSDTLEASVASNRCKLEEITMLEVDSGEALMFVRATYMQADDELPGRTYDAFRSAIWMLLAFRERGETMMAWHDTLLQIAALYSFVGNTTAHTRFHVLGELVHQAYRFNDFQQDIATRLHTNMIVGLLQIAAKQGRESMSCQEIGERTNIAPVFLTRITNNMAACGLIIKKGYGQSARLSLPK